MESISAEGRVQKEMEEAMRKYQEGRERKLTELVCNCCGKKLTVENGIAVEESCHIEIPWGYFSKRDGENHIFDLCEECYDKIICGFAVPPMVEERTEIF